MRPGRGLKIVGAVIAATMFLGAVFVGCAVLCFWMPSIIVDTSGQDLRPSKERPWEREEVNSFVEALRAQLSRE